MTSQHVPLESGLDDIPGNDGIVLAAAKEDGARPDVVEGVDAEPVGAQDVAEVAISKVPKADRLVLTATGKRRAIWAEFQGADRFGMGFEAIGLDKLQ